LYLPSMFSCVLAPIKICETTQTFQKQRLFILYFGHDLLNTGLTGKCNTWKLIQPMRPKTYTVTVWVKEWKANSSWTLKRGRSTVAHHSLNETVRYTTYLFVCRLYLFCLLAGLSASIPLRNKRLTPAFSYVYGKY